MLASELEERASPQIYTITKPQTEPATQEEKKDKDWGLTEGTGQVQIAQGVKSINHYGVFKHYLPKLLKSDS